MYVVVAQEYHNSQGFYRIMSVVNLLLGLSRVAHLEPSPLRPVLEIDDLMPVGGAAPLLVELLPDLVAPLAEWVVRVNALEGDSGELLLSFLKVLYISLYKFEHVLLQWLCHVF